MTYRGFHYRITLPLLAACVACWASTGLNTAGLLSMGALCLIVVVFTYPWDSWAVRRGVWEFPDDRLLRRIGVLPIEEIAFFVLQTLQVSCLTLALLRWGLSSHYAPAQSENGNVIGAGIILLVAVLVHFLSRSARAQRPELTYAWHLGIWFIPLIGAQWMFAFDILASCGGAIAASTMIIGTLLSLADVWAVKHGIWFFDERQILGWTLRGILPLEEVAFFYLTSLLVAQSIVLFIPVSLR
ncbi:MAG: lycopene cyclase domain-containing protein [Candidatus Kapabacteria bacterium]|nr:lycopene cyclase domain-containing protein [Candidatus Kapabacteria bacterium]